MCFFLTQVLYLMPWGACAFYALYILFNSIQFNSFHFISILFSATKITKYYEKKENNEILRKKRKITKYYEILRKKGNTLRKNHVIVIFYTKTVYFFIHLKNKTIAFPFFSSVSFFSFLFVICELRFFY